MSHPDRKARRRKTLKLKNILKLFLHRPDVRVRQNFGESDRMEVENHSCLGNDKWRRRESEKGEREREREGVSEQMASIELHQLERSFRNIQNLPKLSFWHPRVELTRISTKCSSFRLKKNFPCHWIMIKKD